MTNQLWGPLINLTGDGGFLAWTIGGWFTMKYANVVLFVIIAVLFLGGMFLKLPEKKGSP